MKAMIEFLLQNKRKVSDYKIEYLSGGCLITFYLSNNTEKSFFVEAE